jgi:VWFA-related protein
MRVLTWARLVAVGVALVCLAGSTPWQPDARLNAQSAPQSLPTFRSGVDIVQLDVVVLDKNRKPVAGLTANDFTILEDGKPRPLAAFAPVSLPEWPESGPTSPASATWTREASLDVFTNQRPGDGRVVVIVMDRTIPMEQPTVAARKIAHAIVDALGPNDVATVVRTGHFNGEGFQQGFTADRARLRRAIDAPFIGLTNPPEMTLGGLVRNPDGGSRLDCDEFCELEQLTNFTRALESETRRQKTMFLIANRLLISDVSGRNEGLLSVYRGRLFDALSRSNVTVNVLDPVGLQTLARTADAFPAPGNPGYAQRIGPNVARQEELKVLPTYTGGQTVLNTNVPEIAIPLLFDETRSYYLLAYELGNAKRDGTKRSIRVKVNRPDVIVRSRTGVVPMPAAARRDESESAAPAEQAANNTFPKADIPLGLGLVPVFDAGGPASVSATVSLPIPSTVPSSRLPAGMAERYEVAIRTFTDRAVAVSTLRQVVEIPDSDGLGGLSAFEHTARLPVGPGHYEVRVSVSSAGTGQTGSVYGYVDVPDTKKDALLLSGIALHVPSPRAQGLAVDGDGRPTLRRVFTPSDAVTASLQIRRDPKHASVELTMRVRDVGDRTAFVSTTAFGPSGLGDAGVIAVSEPLPTSGLAPGDYVLTVEAKDADGTQSRDVRFTIR